MSTGPDPQLAQEFVAFAVQAGVLRFGEFTTKAGRLSPYFFNAGLFCDGARLGRLAEFYARRLLADADGADLGFDMLFGPAYKGITLAAAVAVELARRGQNLPFAYNRKEAKDHGEGGLLVGAPLAGRVLVIDDVISAGTSVRESIAIIRGAGAQASAVAIALDRQECIAERPQSDAMRRPLSARGAEPSVRPSPRRRTWSRGPQPAEGDRQSGQATLACDAGADAPWSAVQYVTRELRLRVSAVATLGDLLAYLRGVQDPALAAFAAPVAAYRDRYGV